MFFKRLFGNNKEAQSAAGGKNTPAAAVVTDLHSHLIPGIDDGSQQVEDSIAMLKELHALGFQKFITTPHIMADSFPNTPATIRKGLDQLLAAVEKENLPIVVEAAAEYYLDEEFKNKLNGELLTFGGSKKYLLFETSYVTRPMVLEETLFDLQMAGYQPVLAHPERYHFFWEDGGVDAIEAIADKGIKLQMNIGSLAGSYSVRAGKVAKQLLRKDLIDFIGTDLHRLSQVSRLPKAFADNDLQKIIREGRLLNPKL